MKLEFIGLLSTDGGFADVWRARDELGRELAIKIVRDASVGISNALQHARALARAKHPNVVVVHAIEQVTDPSGSGLVDAVVMELLPGETVGSRLKGSALSIEELATVGRGVIAAIRHIHEQGMVHGDLHEENLMISNGEAKVIDLLNRHTFGAADAVNREKQTLRELRSLKQILQQLIGHSEADSQHCNAFTEAVRGNLLLEEIGTAFENAISAEPPSRLRLEHPRTPINLLDIVTPDMDREHVRMLLGPPSFLDGTSWRYRYRETQVQISFTKEGAVDTVVVALCARQKYLGRNPTGHTDLPLGELTLADVLEGGNEVEDIEYLESMRTRDVYLRGRWGPPGAWRYYACGALYVMSGAGDLADVEFDWDEKNGCLLTEPSRVLINWVASMSNYSSDVPGFNWFI